MSVTVVSRLDNLHKTEAVQAKQADLVAETASAEWDNAYALASGRLPSSLG